MDLYKPEVYIHKTEMLFDLSITAYRHINTIQKRELHVEYNKINNNIYVFTCV